MTAYQPDALVAADIDAYLDTHAHKTMLRFITCGSVDDGKSTLIGRLLYDSKTIFEDQLSALEADSRRVGTQGQNIDFALLVDGLAAEREQGITIDVAYRFFATDKRKFIVADTPGHEQYTRNMVTGASTADLAVILIDARKGVLTQTRRHSYLAHLIGIKQIVLAVNKMDLVGNDQAVFDAIIADYRAFASSIPGSRRVHRDSVVGADRREHRDAFSRYALVRRGPSLLPHLESVPVDADARQTGPFRLPVQWVNRPDLDFRGFAGTIASGVVRTGDPVRIVPSGRTTSVRANRDVRRRSGRSGRRRSGDAGTGRSGRLFAWRRDRCGRRSAAGRQPVQRQDRVDGGCAAGARPRLLAEAVDAERRRDRAATAPCRRCEYAGRIVRQDAGIERYRRRGSLYRPGPIVFTPYADSQELGGFILIDRETNATVAAGMIDFALQRAQNVHWQAVDVTREAHARQKGQTPRLLWFTGLSGSGKSTIANLVEQKLFALGRHSFLLDGDNVRHGLNKDLGFTDGDRVENIRRVGEVAKLMTDAGLIVLTAFISPFRAERNLVRAMMKEADFVEIFVDTPLADAEARDVKGLYAKARSGTIANFTGISSPYEAPEKPEIRIDTTKESAEDAAERIVEHILGVWSPDL